MYNAHFISSLSFSCQPVVAVLVQVFGDGDVNLFEINITLNFTLVE